MLFMLCCSLYAVSAISSIHTHGPTATNTNDPSQHPTGAGRAGARGNAHTYMQQAAAARLSAVESSLRGGDAPDDLLPELRSASGSRNSDGAADLVTIERQRRQLLEARLAAQMEANAALRRDNLELASHLTATSQQLRAALRSRDELRRQTAEAASVDKAIREAVSRRALQASQALCASLRARVSTLEEQVGAGAQSLRSRWTPQGAPPHTLLHTSIPLRKR